MVREHGNMEVEELKANQCSHHIDLLQWISKMYSFSNWQNYKSSKHKNKVEDIKNIYN